MSPTGYTSRNSIAHAVLLCESGKWIEASEALAGFSAGPERLMLEGCVLSFTEPEAAKDLLNAAIRELRGGELRDKARIWLARCYWTIGEIEEGRDILTAIDPPTVDIRFLVGLSRSVFEGANLGAALFALTEIESLVDSVCDLYRAKFFNQRAWIMRRRASVDAAILDYESARFWFERSESPRFVAMAANNLAGLLVDAKRYEDAHEAVGSALRILPTSDWLYIAQVLDQQAGIFLSEGIYDQAERCSSRSLALLDGRDNKSVLVTSLITHGKALRGLNRFVEALNDLNQARALAEYLQNKSTLLSVLKEERETAEQLADTSRFEAVQVALELSDGSLRDAARVLGIKHQPLDRFIRLHNIPRHPKVKKSIITKPYNRLTAKSKSPTKKS